jgi:tetratricopeptide (TPR) repeat protein
MRWIRIAAASMALGLLLASQAFGQAAREGVSTPVPQAPPEATLSPEEQRRELLDKLFGRLQVAKTDEEAKVAEQAIWRLWMHSGSPTDDLLLEQAVKAMNARDYSGARSILDVLIDHAPKFAEAWNRRATINYITGKLDQSLSDIDKVLELEPRHFGALSGLGMIRKDRGDERGALEAFRDALAINPYMSNVRDAVRALEKDLEQKI